MVSPNSEPYVTSSDGCHTRVNVKRSNYLWVIHDFKSVHDKRGIQINSLPFSADDDKFKWRLSLNLNPQGENSGSIMLFLSALNDDNLSKHTPITGVLKVSLIDAKNQPRIVTKNTEFSIAHGTSTPSVVPSFVEKSYLFAESNQLLPQDRLTISCEVSYVKKTDIMNIPDQSFSNSLEKDQSAGLIEDIETLFLDDEFADITLCVNGKDYPAHKSIIAARSLYFKALLRAEMTEKKNNRVEIGKINESVFEEVLRYIYTGKLQNLGTLVSELLEAADRFNLEKLKSICTKEMLKNISKENLVDILVLADRYN